MSGKTSIYIYRKSIDYDAQTLPDIFTLSFISYSKERLITCQEKILDIPFVLGYYT